jgi:hypothetical protein
MSRRPNDCCSVSKESGGIDECRRHLPCPRQRREDNLLWLAFQYLECGCPLDAPLRDHAREIGVSSMARGIQSPIATMIKLSQNGTRQPQFVN